LGSHQVKYKREKIMGLAHVLERRALKREDFSLGPSRFFFTPLTDVFVALRCFGFYEPN
jgi:hypothetical protein